MPFCQQSIWQRSGVEVTPYEVKRSFYSYGDRLMMYAKFRLTKEPKPLRIESIGSVEIDVQE